MWIFFRENHVRVDGNTLAHKGGVVKRPRWGLVGTTTLTAVTLKIPLNEPKSTILATYVVYLTLGLVWGVGKGWGVISRQHRCNQL